MSDSPLRVPELAMPAFPWRPGRSPRPPEPALDADLRTTVLHGADLFDHGAWWEAHAIWEHPWKGALRGSALREALQGLIQTAAYHLKTRPDLARAGERLRTRALERLDAAIQLGSPTLFDLDLVRLRRDLAAHRVGEPPLRLHAAPTVDTE